MSPAQVQAWTHHDAQDDEIIVACYDNIGVGPAVVFNGGGFTDPETLWALVASLAAAAEWLQGEA